MGTLKYTIIKTGEQYNEYCNILEKVNISSNTANQDEIELLNLLIEKWDDENNSFSNLNPVELIKALLEENNLKSEDLSKILDLSKGTVSKILNYQKGLSKETIRKLSLYFRVSQDTFNQPYKPVNEINRHLMDASLMNTKKEMTNVITM
jgi:HTH-type transcriptional regulator / antitoxin HigA